ncbi:MAG: hypothetical protein IKL03_09060 [Bacteroidaceae bacterium]|nr:hypothetical protein [Bacteroidaceae bacterium]
MKVKSIYIAISTALLTLTFMACQEEVLHEGPCQVRFVASVQDEVSVTRATEGYTALSQTDYPNFTAGLYVSYGTTAQEYPIEWANNNALTANLGLEAYSDPYYFYGYAPKQNDASFDNSNKTLTIPNIPGLSDKDMLVIKPCSATVTSDDISNGKKTISLQMDHLMAKITPYFYINSEYNKLRDIHIKNVTFSLDDSKTFQANVSYTTSPYVTEWSIINKNQSQSVNLYSAAPSDTKIFLTTSSTGAQSYGQCYIVPSQNGQDITNLKMTVTYDVYDKQQQLVRQNETATNKVVVKVGGITKTQLEAGKNYKLNIQIIPTYLYVLSDNDESSVLVIPNN